ncbi:MAG: 50S ribosomal protein L17 [candidate division Zixibacteria bacterium]|nr:50S ribosomal protein L17 [candidate division Zixibacteria bacterium]
MRHGKKVAKLGRTKSHREAMLSNMVTSLFAHHRIKTTQAKAKALRPLAEKLITWAKRNDLQAHRQVYRVVRDREILKSLFSEIAPQLSKRSGGYTRILKLGRRRGDGAEVVLLELLTEKPILKKGEAKEKKGKAEKKETAPKKEKAKKKPLPKKEEDKTSKKEKEDTK